MAVTIWHNPRCSKSRGALQILREHGIEPTVIAYLDTPPDVATLQALVAAMGTGARALLRTREEAYAALGLADPALDDTVLLAAMHAHPELIDRPIVRTPRGVRLGRPPETVLEILPA